MVPKITYRKAGWTLLSFKLNETSTGYKYGEGYYKGKNGIITIYAVGAWKERGAKTYLTFRFNGIDYEREYPALFCDRGLIVICCRFIKDVHKCINK